MIATIKPLVVDGGLMTWALFIVAHGAAAVVSALTIAILLVRLMILVRQWRGGK